MSIHSQIQPAKATWSDHWTVDPSGVTRDKRDPNPRHCVGFRVRSEHETYGIGRGMVRTGAMDGPIYATEADAEMAMRSADRDQPATSTGKPIDRRIVPIATSVACLVFADQGGARPTIADTAIDELVASNPGLGRIQARNQLLTERCMRAAAGRTRHSRRFA